MVSAKQRAWRRKFGMIWGGKGRRHRRSSIMGIRMSRGTKYRVRKVVRRVYSMARRRGRRSRGGLGMGRLLSMRNILFTVAGAAVVPRVLGVNSQLGGAIGGFLGAGPIGAVAGYFLGSPIASATSGILGGTSSSGTAKVYA